MPTHKDIGNGAQRPVRENERSERVGFILPRIDCVEAREEGGRDWGQPHVGYTPMVVL